MFGGTIFLGDSANAKEVKLDSNQRRELEYGAAETVDAALAELEDMGEPE